jgi:thiamine kinase-like enzyme
MKKISNKIITPQYPSEITAEWLGSILFPEKSKCNSAVSMEIDNSFGPWSLLGKAVRVKLKYSGEECAPESLIVKFQVSTLDPEREGTIYKLLLDADVPFIPHLYCSFGNGNLVLEDLTPTHSVLKEDFKIPQIRNVVSKLSEIQGKFWNDSRVPQFDNEHYANSININMGQSWDIFKNRYYEQLGNEAAAFEWILKNPEIIASHYNSSPSSLSHGDVNNSNMLFPNDRSGRPIFIDWQLSARRVIPFDLSYFIVKSLTVEQRRMNEEKLLKEYYILLSEQIRRCYAFDRFVLDYRASLTRSMLSAVMRVGPRYESHPNRFEGADKLAARVITAVRELKPIEAIQELKK